MKGKKTGIMITFDDLKQYGVTDLLAGKQLLDDIHGASLDRKGIKYVSITIVLLDHIKTAYDITLSTNIHKDDADLDMLVELLPNEILEHIKNQI